MRLLGKVVGSLAAGDIAALIENGVGESRTLEYKEQLPGGTDADKREFLADVSAMANTAGGVIVYGMATVRDAANNDTGIARQAIGTGETNADPVRLRLMSLLHDGLSPSIGGRVTLQDLTV